MNILTIALLIDLIMSLLVIVYTVNYMRLKEEPVEVYEEEEKASEPELPKLEIDGNCTITQRLIDSRAYRDVDGMLRRIPPRHIVEVELETPVDSENFMRTYKIVKTNPDIEFIGYVCDGGKRIIEY